MKKIITINREKIRNKCNLFDRETGTYLYMYDDIIDGIRIKRTTLLSTIIVNIPDYVPEEIYLGGIDFRPHRVIKLYWSCTYFDCNSMSKTRIITEQYGQVKPDHIEINIKFPKIKGTNNIVFVDASLPTFVYPVRVFDLVTKELKWIDSCKYEKRIKIINGEQYLDPVKEINHDDCFLIK